MKLSSVARLSVVLLVTLGTACVSTDPDTGKALPRGDQRYLFSEVVEKAEDLQIGLVKRQVLLLLGSPAETDEGGETWVYLPERMGILVPARALRLRFEEGRLAEYGYHAIALGQEL